MGLTRLDSGWMRWARWGGFFGRMAVHETQTVDELTSTPPSPLTEPTPPHAVPIPPQLTVWFRWWAIGGGIGVLAALLVGSLVWIALPATRYQAEMALDPPRPLPRLLDTERPTAGPSPSARAEVLNPALLKRACEDPKVASLDTIRFQRDPVRLLEERVSVEEGREGVLTVRMWGDRRADLPIIVDTIAQLAAEEMAKTDREQRVERSTRLNELIEKYRTELEAREKQSALHAYANGVIGLAATDTRIAGMQSELTRLAADVAATEKEAQELEILVSLFQKKIDSGRFDPNLAEIRALVETDPRVIELARQRATKLATLEREKRIAGNAMVAALRPLVAEIERLDGELADARQAAEPGVKAMAEKATETQLRNRLADAQDKLEATKKLLASRSKHWEEYQKALVGTIRGGLAISSQLKDLEPTRDLLHKLQAQRLQLAVEKDLGHRIPIQETPVVSRLTSTENRLGMALSAGVAAFLVIFLCALTTRMVSGPSPLTPI